MICSTTTKPSRANVSACASVSWNSSRSCSGLFLFLRLVGAGWMARCGSDLGQVASAFVVGDEAMAGGGLDAAAGGVVLNEGGAEEVAGSGAALQTVGRLE